MWIGYINLDDKNQCDNIDPMESDEALEEYIERRRREFHNDWNEYQTKAYE